MIKEKEIILAHLALHQEMAAGIGRSSCIVERSPAESKGY